MKTSSHSSLNLSISIALISIGLLIFSNSLFRRQHGGKDGEVGKMREGEGERSIVKEGEGGGEREREGGRGGEREKEEGERGNENLKAKDEERRKTVVVVGGGLAGLSAAIESERAGCHVILVDKESGLGGNSAKASSGINGCGTNAQVYTNVRYGKV